MSEICNHALYDLLAARAVQNEEPLDQLDLATTINQSVSKEMAEIILSLMYHFYFKETGKIPTKALYAAKINRGGKGVIFNMASIPPTLQRIIHEYLLYQST